MIVRSGAVLLALAPGLAAAAGCLSLSSSPDGAALARYELAASGTPTFTLSYVHSVTRTPVVETYRIDGDAIVQTEIRFSQHGPGLPTQADAGGTFERRDGQFVLSMSRRLPSIVMRVNADQRPELRAGTLTVDLAGWGNRAIALHAADAPCASH